MFRHFANQSIFYRMNHAKSYDQVVQVMARVIFIKNEELDSQNLLLHEIQYFGLLNLL